jgi:hypothetical protein
MRGAHLLLFTLGSGPLNPKFRPGGDRSEPRAHGFRHTSMGIAGEQASGKLDLWREYRLAFQEFARKVENIESLKANASSGPTSIEMALLELERARVRYNNCRDALAAALLSGSPREFRSGSASVSPRPHTERIREIAELIWAFENKREGRADEDWFRAEKIIRCAAESTPEDCLQEALR